MKDIEIFTKYAPECIDWVIFSDGMITSRNNKINVIRAPCIATLIKHTKRRLIQHIAKGSREFYDKNDIPVIKNCIDNINNIL